MITSITIYQHLSSMIIWLVEFGIPLIIVIPNILGSRIPELIIHQQVFSSHCSWCSAIIINYYNQILILIVLLSTINYYYQLLSTMISYYHQLLP